jgi:hypothetical protein
VSFAALFEIVRVLDLEVRGGLGSLTSSSSSSLRASTDGDALESSFVPIVERAVVINAVAFSCGHQLHRFAALYLSNNYVVFHFAESPHDTPVVKFLYWLPGEAKRIVALDIDARSSLLLLTSLDGTVTLVPIYFIVKNRQFFSAASPPASSLTSSAGASMRSSASSSAAASSSFATKLLNFAEGSVQAAASLLGARSTLASSSGSVGGADDDEQLVGDSPIVHCRLNLSGSTINCAVLWNTRYVIAGTADGYLRIYSLADSAEVYSYKLKAPMINVSVVCSGGITCALIMLHRESYMLLFLESGKQSILRDANDGEPVPIRRKGVVSVQHFHNDDYLAVITPDEYVDVFSMRDATTTPGLPASTSGFPIYVFRLPTMPQQLIFGKHVIFVRGNQTELFIVSRAFAASQRGARSVDPYAAVLARYDFGTAVLAMYVLPPCTFGEESAADGTGLVDGVLVVLADRVLEVRASQAPATLFGALAERGDVRRAERLGMVFELDVVRLLARSARARLAAGDGNMALELFVAAGTDACEAATLLIQHGHVPQARKLLEVAYAARATLVPKQRRALIHMLATLHADALAAHRLALESRVASGGDSIAALTDERQCASMLSSEADVDVDGALQVLLERNLVDLMLVMAHARGEVERALALLATRRRASLSEANVQYLLTAGYARALLRNEALLDDVSAAQRVALLLADHTVAGDWRRRARALLPRLAAPQLLDVARALLDSRDPDSVELRIEVLLLLVMAVRHSPRAALEQLKEAIGSGDADRRNVNADSVATSVLSPHAAIDLPLAVRSVACGAGHVLAAAERGIVLAWGNNGSGQLGLGDTTDRGEPTIVMSLAGVEHAHRVACGAEHSVAVMSTGYVFAWGAGESGQLGYTPAPNRDAVVRPFASAPRRAALGSTGDVVAAACGERFTLLLTLTGAVLACGLNSDGQLGLGDRESRAAPTLVPDTGTLLTISHVAAGARHSMLCTNAGELYASGAADRSQLTAATTAFALIGSLRGKRVVRVACGSAHNVALTDLGHVYSWGEGVAQPTLMESLSSANVADVACGDATVLALTDKKNVLVWRSGDAFAKTIELPPETTVAAVACGSKFCAAVSSVGVPLLWTENALGVVSIVASMSPTPTAAATPLVSTLAAFIRSRSPPPASASPSGRSTLSSTGAPIEKVLPPLRRRMSRPDLASLDDNSATTTTAAAASTDDVALADELCDTTQQLLEDALVGSFGVFRSINVLRRCLDADNLRAATLVASALDDHVCALQCALDDVEQNQPRVVDASATPAAAQAARLARAFLASFDGVMSRVPLDDHRLRAAVLRLLLERWVARALPRKSLESALAARVDELAPALAHVMADAASTELGAILSPALRVDVLRRAVSQSRGDAAGDEPRLWHEVRGTLARGLTARTHVVSHKPDEAVAFTCGHELTRDAFNSAKTALSTARADAGRLFTRQLLLKDYDLVRAPINMACPECVKQSLN